MVSLQQNDDDSFRKHASNSPPSSPDVSDIDGVTELGPRIGPKYQIELPSVIEKSKWKREYRRGVEGTTNAIEHEKAVKVEKNSLSDNVEELKPTTFQSVMTGDSKSGQLVENKNYLTAPGRLSNPWSDADIKCFVLGLFIFGKNFNQVKRFLENKGMGEILSFYYAKFYKSDEYCRWSKCRKTCKRRKCEIGQKLFRGQRQQELLSRLILHVPEETHNTLRQLSESYVEGRICLEQYANCLKSAGGIGVLVEAVGIGKEKEDLTRFVVKKNQMFSEPTCKPWSSLGPSEIMNFLTGDSRLSKTKSRELFWEAVWPRLLARGWHSEQPKNNGYVTSKGYLVFLIPGVKKFSRRKLVKGNHYFDSVTDVLSKVVGDPDLLELEEEAKVGSCNEEEPEKGLCKDEESIDHPQCYLNPQASTCNKDHMEFMIIDTSLVQGGKSSDVRELKSVSVNSMGRVEVEAAAGIIHGKRKRTRKANHKDMSKSIKQKSTKSPVIDTSILSGSGGQLLKVGQLSYPPAELEDASKMTGILRESKGSSSKDDSPGVVEAKMLIDEKKNSNKTDSCKGFSNSNATNKKEACSSRKPDKDANKVAEIQQNQKTCEFKDNQLKSTIKLKFIQRGRTGDTNHAAMPTKRRRLTACAKAEKKRIIDNSSSGLESSKPTLSQSSSFPDANKNAGDPVSHQKNRISIASSVNRSVKESNDESIRNDNRQCTSITGNKVEKNCESLLRVTLKIPQVPSKSENDKMLAMVEEEHSKCQKEIGPHLASNTDKEGVEEPLRTPCNGSLEEQPNINPRRQSTRSRPLTIRALESIANEFLHVQRRPKRKDIQTQKVPYSPCPKARIKGNTTSRRHCSDHHQTAVFVQQEKHLPSVS